uniref:Tc1-like transposase DDE domain-containing protein n=1 Tax=Oryzias latipes TaxID=8090 RepID=A0A3P9I187_ORYLA
MRSGVAGELGESQSVISRLAVTHRTTVRVCDRPRSGALPVIDHNHDQNLKTSDLRDGLANATQLQARLPGVRGTGVSRQTIHNRLHRFDLNDGRPFEDHLTWTMQQWSTVFFTDECQVALHRNAGGHQSKTFWVDGPVSNTTNSPFMDDNAPLHGARIITAGLQEVRVPHMVQPPMTPDLNPMEQVWDQLKQRLDDRTPPPNDLVELHVVLVEEWKAFTQNSIMRLVRSMNHCCQAVIAANGGNTYY